MKVIDAPFFKFLNTPLTVASETLPLTECFDAIGCQGRHVGRIKIATQKKIVEIRV